MSSEIPEYRRERKFQFILPEDIVGELEEIANRHHLTCGEVMRKILRCGLVLIAIEEKGEGRMVWRKTDWTEVEVKIFDDELGVPPLSDSNNPTAID